MISTKNKTVCLLILSLCSWQVVSPQRALAQTKHNIVLFLIDDLGWKDLGCQGSTYYQTQNIDALASQGVRFTDAYAACAVCTPTRAAIMTGKYPARTLMTEWLPSGRWNPSARLKEGRFLRDLPREEYTIAEALRDAGYRTGHFGKWHLGTETFGMPEHHGFEINVGGNPHGNPGNYFFPYDGSWKIPTTNRRATWNVLDDGQAGEYLTDRLTEEAVQFIHQSKQDDQPFFLYFPHYGVHTPIQAKKEVTARYERVPKEKRQGMPAYAAMVESIDDSVGKIMDTLRELDLSQDTVVIFTSDNGGFWKATSNAPLRANKGAYYEGGIRVPLIIKWPGVTKAGVIERTPSTSSDLYPTCLTAAGLPLLPNQHQDGVDLTPLLSGDGRIGERALFWHYPHYNGHPSSVPSSVIRKGAWKLIQSYDPAGLELYNLEKDLSETNNLVKQETELTNSLLKELEAWKLSVRAEQMLPNPDFKDQ
ncbi:MAG: sulfatase [Planctomycetaceae bacterium]